LLLLVLLFAGSAFSARAYRRHEERLAEEWSRRGEAELAAGHAGAALDALRTALVYSKENRHFELRLAQALVAAGRDAEAQTYLRTLWEREPGNAEVNLELARLAAKRADVDEALRYYEGSIYGVWPSSGEERRRAVRLELIGFLSAHHRKSEALAAIMGFAANLPPDPALQVRAGELFLAEQSYARALDQFKEALRLEPRNSRALAGAGRATFLQGDYVQAERFLERASRTAPEDLQVGELFALARAILSLDAHARGLSGAARAERALRGFALAQQRLAACVPPAGNPAGAALADLAPHVADLKRKVKLSTLQRDMDLFSAVVELNLRVEAAAQAACGPGSMDDQALALLARHQTEPPQ
jgi:tetratricopeptide (TPR) repeat protein